MKTDRILIGILFLAMLGGAIFAYDAKITADRKIQAAEDRLDSLVSVQSIYNDAYNQSFEMLARHYVAKQRAYQMNIERKMFKNWVGKNKKQ